MARRRRQALAGGLVVLALGGLALLAVILLRDGGVETRPLQGQFADLTLTDVQERALAALSQPGMVLHSVVRTEAGGSSREREVWIDVERDSARSQGGSPGLPFLGPYVVFHQGSAWGLGEGGRFEQRPFGSDMESITPLALDHTLWTLYRAPNTAERSEFRAATIDGVSTIRVEIRTTYDADGHEARVRTWIYLDDQSFLPVLIDEHIDRAGLRDSDKTVRFDHEFLERDSLPEAFFSLDALRAMAVTPVDDIMRAVEEGFVPYWLGVTFEGMELHDVRMAENFGHIRVLVLTYKRGGGGPNDPPPADAPPTGVTITEFSVDGWLEWSSIPSGRSWFLRPGVTQTPLEVPGLQVTLYEDPNAFRPSVSPPPGAGPTPTAPLPDWFGRVVTAQSDQAVLLIEANMGPFESEALARLAGALRPFEAPGE